MEPWYKVVQARKEVREGRSFNPDEFAIALEQVVAGTAPVDYCKPDLFFARTCFTRALRDHAGMVLRRLAGETADTAPVLTLITQFGGGKTHTLTTLYHLANTGPAAGGMPGVGSLLDHARLTEVPSARVGIFVGNAWDPQEGRETPWHDIARQIAGDAGVAALGQSAKTTPPGTEALGRIFRLADKPVLILFDEVLNFVNRHRAMADAFHAFIQNLTVAMTGFERGAAVISLPRSQVEMTDWDLQWQERITKVVRRVAKDLIVNDEAEISEVLRRRLFEDLGDERVRQKVSQEYANWCFERRAQLPPEWTAVDTATTETGAREFLRSRFEACYPFHPATLSVFQRKWQTLAQYQQTRGTLAMLAQWISCAGRDGYRRAAKEPLITLGSAPLDAPEFRSVVLGQLGETRLSAGIEADIAGKMAHARALDADTKDALLDIHRRVGTAILFESSGGQRDQTAHLPELRFALGQPGLDTTSIDSAAMSLEAHAYFIRKVGADGFRIRYQPTLKKVVNDRRSSLDAATDIRPAMEALVKAEFEKGRTIPTIYFPAESDDVPDSPRLTLAVLSPSMEWNGNGDLRARMADWTVRRGSTDRFYPAALLWCVKKAGRELYEQTAWWLAWQRVSSEIANGTLEGEFDKSDRQEVSVSVKQAEDAARDEVWASYRFVALLDNRMADRLQEIDLGAGHSSARESLCGRVLAALKTGQLLNESVGAGYIDRNWPQPLVADGAWPLAGLRQCFLSGALTRLLDPDTVLRNKIVEFVERGDFGLASGANADGTYNWVWYCQAVGSEEVRFENDVYLLRKARAIALKNVGKPAVPAVPTPTAPGPAPKGPPLILVPPAEAPTPGATTSARRVRLAGSLPPESWNRLGTRVIPKLRSGANVRVTVELSADVDAATAQTLATDLQQVLADLDLSETASVDVT